MTATLSRKRVWTVADFARHAGMSPWAAKRRLKRLDAKHHGKLLIPSAGMNRAYTFYPAVLARLEPDLFTPVESIEFRLEHLEEDVAEVRRHAKVIVGQVGANTRRIEQLRLRFDAR